MNLLLGIKVTEGLVAIADTHNGKNSHSRDAADTAIASIFGA